MLADLHHGQKTGHFLDQQENRGRIRPYCADAQVLDLCCHTGGFSIHAALYGAKSVESVDVSQDALDMLTRNENNGVAQKLPPFAQMLLTWCGITVCPGGNTIWSFAILPPLPKSKSALARAYRGYKELNLRCMRLVRPGGYLATWSCSQFMTPPLFFCKCCRRQPQMRNVPFACWKP